MLETLKNAWQEMLKTPYQKDADLVKRWTGAELTEKQFDTYKNTFTLRKKMGSNDKILNALPNLGNPIWITLSQITQEILETLHDTKVVFDIETKNEELFEKLSETARTCLTQSIPPALIIIDPYIKSPRLLQSIADNRKKMGLSTPPPLQPIR